MKCFRGIPYTVVGIIAYTVAPLCVSAMALAEQYALILQIPSLLLIVWGVLSESRKDFSIYDTSRMSFLYAVYILLCVVMFLRGYSISERHAVMNLNAKLFLILGDGTYILWTIIPLVALKSFACFSVKDFIKPAMFFCVVLSIYSLINLPSLLQKSLLYAAGIESEGDGVFAYSRVFESFSPLFLCMYYLNKKERIILWISCILNMTVLVLMARRGALAMCCLLVFFLVCLSLPRQSGWNKIITISFLAVGLIFIIINIADISVFDFLVYRGFEDTRSGVESSMLSQMTVNEQIFGKGLNGCYYEPLRDTEFYNGWRYLCETGFLNIVLKGGYLMAILYVILLLVPSIKGILHSRNVFCKAGGLYILWSLVYLYPAGILNFNISFFFVWIWVIACSHKSILNMRDDEVQSLFFT